MCRQRISNLTRSSTCARGTRIIPSPATDFDDIQCLMHSNSIVTKSQASPVIFRVGKVPRVFKWHFFKSVVAVREFTARLAGWSFSAWPCHQDLSAILLFAGSQQDDESSQRSRTSTCVDFSAQASAKAGSFAAMF